MQNPQKSKSHPSITRLLGEKSREIEIPSLQCLIIRWKIIRNRNPIPSMLDYWIENREKSEFHPSNARLLDEKS